MADMSKRIKNLCVFCGSRLGNKNVHNESAVDFGKALANLQIGLVYGGSSIGMMGVLANSVLTNGGKVTGVLPKNLKDKELAHQRLTEMIVVESLHARKQKMFELSDGFVALPGGLGTFEELCEVLTWQQFGIHGKPCGILNVGGYFDPFLAMLDQAVADGFLDASHRKSMIIGTRAEELITQFRDFSPSKKLGWMNQSET